MLLLAAGKGEQHQAKAQLDAFLASPDLGHDPEPTHGLCFFRLPRSGMGRLVGQRISDAGFMNVTTPELEEKFDRIWT